MTSAIFLDQFYHAFRGARHAGGKDVERNATLEQQLRNLVALRVFRGGECVQTLFIAGGEQCRVGGKQSFYFCAVAGADGIEKFFAHDCGWNTVSDLASSQSR